MHANLLSDMNGAPRALKTYRAIMSRLTAWDIADPLPMVRPDETCEEAWFRVTEDPFFWAAETGLVRDETTIYGYVDVIGDLFEMLGDPNIPVITTAKAIPANQIVSAETPLLDLLPLFPQHFFFFLLQRNEFVGVVSYVHVDRPPLQLCLFALILELEAAMLHCLMRDRPRVTHYLSLLKADRRERAEKLARLKRRNKNPAGVLECTTLIDKTNMILKSELASSLEAARTEETPQRFLSRVEAVRNEIAHGGSVLQILRDPKDLVSFTEKLQRIISILASESDSAN